MLACMTSRGTSSFKLLEKFLWLPGLKHQLFLHSEPIPAWPLHQRADWLNNMEELTIDVKVGPVEKLTR